MIIIHKSNRLNSMSLIQVANQSLLEEDRGILK